MLRRVLAFGFVLAIYALADEGMWLFDHFPKEQVLKSYAFTVTDDFLRHLLPVGQQAANIRFAKSVNRVLR